MIDWNKYTGIFIEMFNKALTWLRSFREWFRKGWVAKLVLFLVISLVPPLLLIYLTVFKPLDRASDISGQADTTDQVKTAQIKFKADQLSTVRQMEGMELEKAFLRNRIALAGQDSVYLTLNLDDSTMTLEIKGVTVRVCKVRELEISRRFSRISKREILAWVSMPFVTQEARATIPKSPIVIKNAPKDTLEAQATSAEPAPPELNSVYFTLQFDRHLLVEVEQIEPIPPDDRKLIRKYRRAKRRETASEVLRSMLHFRPPKQDLWIKLWLDDKDARAVYRAIPEKAQMAFKPHVPA